MTEIGTSRMTLSSLLASWASRRLLNSDLDSEVFYLDSIDSQD